MTKEEALKILDTIPTIGEQVDALEMAIEALERPDRKKVDVDKILGDLADNRNSCVTECRVRIAEEQGKIKGMDDMIKIFLHLLNVESEEE